MTFALMNVNRSFIHWPKLGKCVKANRERKEQREFGPPDKNHHNTQRRYHRTGVPGPRPTDTLHHTVMWGYHRTCAIAKRPGVSMGSRMQQDMDVLAHCFLCLTPFTSEISDKKNRDNLPQDMAVLGTRCTARFTLPRSGRQIICFAIFQAIHIFQYVCELKVPDTKR